MQSAMQSAVKSNPLARAPGTAPQSRYRSSYGAQCPVACSSRTRTVVWAAQQRSDSQEIAEALPTRRQAVASLGAAVSLLCVPDSAHAAYGEGARVFAKTREDSDFQLVEKDGYSVLVYSKWNPNKSVVEGSSLRFADNMRDDGANMDVIVEPSNSKNIKDLGSLDDFLPRVAGLLGSSASFVGETQSEGGFDPDQVATAALLEAEEKKGRNGETFYTYHILTRTADGEGGGRHHLFASTVANGKLITLQTQALDKQWFKGSEKVLRKIMDSFTVAA